jgi:Spy/CpxP family protein refolding chaperone
MIFLTNDVDEKHSSSHHWLFSAARLSLDALGLVVLDLLQPFWKTSSCCDSMTHCLASGACRLRLAHLQFHGCILRMRSIKEYPGHGCLAFLISISRQGELTMKRAYLFVFASCISMALVVAGVCIAQEKSDKKGDAKEKSTNRLPDNYGKIGLTDAQKSKIYAIQEKARTEIEALQKQIAEKRAAEDKDIEGVLSPEQKAIVGKLKEEAETKKKEAKQKAKDKKEGAAPGSKTGDKPAAKP